MNETEQATRWEIIHSPPEGEDGSYIIGRTMRSLVSDGPGDAHYEEDFEHIATAYHPDHARLIAADPELLEALENIVNNATLAPDEAMQFTTDCYRVPLDDIEEARAAIAKARGQS